MRAMLAALAVLMLGGEASAQSAPAAPPPPPCSQAAYRQLDFWVGDWDAEFDLGNGKVGHATNRITKDEYGSCVIAEHFLQPDIAYVGGSLSMFDASSKQWRQVWVDNGGGWIPLVGGPVAGQDHVFELHTTEARGPKKLWYRMIWQEVTPTSFTWRWQSRAEGTEAWTDAWVIRYTRKKG